MTRTVYCAFQNRKSGLLLAGTDFNHSPPRHRYSNEARPPLLVSGDARELALVMLRRNITRSAFRVIELRLREEEIDPERVEEIWAAYAAEKRARS